MLILSAALTAFGTIFILIAAVGILRLPDLFMRMSATTKVQTLGASLILAATAIHFQDVGVAARALATICFIILTSPIAAHMIGKAAYATGVPLWERTVQDDLKKYYQQTRQDEPADPQQRSENR